MEVVMAVLALGALGYGVYWMYKNGKGPFGD